MRFRTEIEPFKGLFKISHDSRILLLGSCFADAIGRRLLLDGFEATVNPVGTLYNPLSILQALRLAMHPAMISADLLTEHDGRLHFMDLASTYSGTCPEQILDHAATDLNVLRHKLLDASTVVITFGSAWVYELDGTSRIVGNCHKLPPERFVRRRLSVEEAAEAIEGILDTIGSERNVILTVSPIRHLADGLHGNQLSKATLQLAIDSVLTANAHPGVQYFPSYEALLDDLRDYRFYADDLKHPSEMAENYIYDFFSHTYYTTDTIAEATRRRAENLRKAHRQIITT